MYRVIPRRLVAFSKEEVTTLIKCLFRKNDRDKVKLFEDAFAQYIGAPHSIAVSSVREGFALALECLNLEPDDEVILSAYNYHVMPILVKDKGFKPVFVDIQANTLNINADCLESQITPRTKCIIATHLFGLSADIEKIHALCKKHNILLMEDVAHSCGSEVNGRKIGSFGDLSFFSFGTGKGLVTLGGGMIVSNNSDLFDKVKKAILQTEGNYNRLKSMLYYLKSLMQIMFTNRFIFAIFIFPFLLLFDLFRFDPIETLTGDKYTPADVSSKNKLSPFRPFQADLGLTQLQRLDQVNDQRIANARLLDELLQDVENLRRVRIPEGRVHTVLSYTIVTPRIRELRHYLLLNGIDTKESSMRNCAKLFEDSKQFQDLEQVDDQILELTCSQYLSKKDIYYLGNVIRKFYKKDPIHMKA